jgi:AmmeMemoRadiSam system protein A
MSELTTSDQAFLLSLARHEINAMLKSGANLQRPASLSPAVFENRGCFVTLHQNQELRGCIGTIEPDQALIDNVAENAANAAFRDPRFSPVTLSEIDGINIEISVLTPPKELTFKDGEDLKRQLKPGIHGVILSRNWHRSTFLPQVWEQLPDKEMFLEHLCLKGGMGRDCWKSRKTKAEVYTASYFSE